WTQTYAQVDTEAGKHGFDENYFVSQVAGLSQIAGEFMHVRLRIIDLGWGELKSAIIKTKDERLLAQYVDAFRKVEAGKDAEASGALKEIGDKNPALGALIDAQRAKLT